jgi:leucyl aminopeptidase
MNFELSANSLNKISSDGAIVFTFENKKDKTFLPHRSFSEMDKLLNGKLEKAAKLENYTGGRGEVLVFVTDDAFLFSRVVVVGLGNKEKFKLNDLRRAMGAVGAKFKNKIDSLSLDLPTDLEKDLGNLTQVICEGFILGSYQFNKYKQDQKHEKELSAIIFANLEKSKEVENAIESAKIYSEATIIARNLVNEPSSLVNPTFLAETAMEIAKNNPSVTCKIIDCEEAEKMGMGGFLSVAKGSDTPPKFIHLEYKAKEKSAKKLAIVGKGVTFDSGGISLKPQDSLMTMKCDMSGAAAVLGVFSVITKISPSFSVMGIIAATPNLISGRSTMPGDVAKTLNGKSIEILNTDAEGRVTMADSLYYASKEGATEIIDLATLTGAVMVALGSDITGLFSNNSDFAKEIKNAADLAGEKLWELPLFEDYRKLNKSEVADISNIPSTRWGGAITAALFLEEFVDDKKWAHLDIAGPAFLDKPNELGPKGGTGFGVRTLLNLLKK